MAQMELVRKFFHERCRRLQDLIGNFVYMLVSKFAVCCALVSAEKPIPYLVHYLEIRYLFSLVLV